MDQDQIIISGATGFVGQNIIPYLSGKGLNVVTLSRSKPPQRLGYSNSELQKRAYEKHLTYKSIQKQDWNNARTFIHLAGKAHDVKNTADSAEYFKVNRDLTINLFDQFLASNCKTFIFLSSVKAAADQVEGLLTEDHVPNPKTAYGKSKHAAEQYLLNHRSRADKNIIILRPCMIHGPGNKGNLNLLLKAVSYHIPWVFGSFENERSYCSIDNLCFIIYRILSANSINSGIYHVADDTSISTNNLIKIIAKTLDKRLIRFNFSKVMLLTVARLGDRYMLPFTTQVLSKVTGTYEVSNLKIKQELGIKNMPLSTEEGLFRTIASF
jgi:nucleoside-diphosphate-sugar epimerase